MKKHIPLVTAFATLGCLALAAPEEKTSLEKIPAKAAEALRHYAGGAEIKHVSKETDEGKTVYEASFKAEGGVREVTVGEGGQLISQEQTVPLAKVPEKVQQTVSKHSEGGKIEKLERVQEHGKTTYEALISAKGKRTEIVMDGNGKVLETENKTGDPDKN